MAGRISYEEKAKRAVNALVDYAYQTLEMPDCDMVYAKNQLLDLLKLDAPSDEPLGEYKLYSALADIEEYALRQGFIVESERINFETRVMGVITPAPSAVIEAFDETVLSAGAMKAAKWLYDFGFETTYIRKPDIDKNIFWRHECERGNIDITINLSKPEKSPEEVLRAKSAPTGYPKCVLCQENVGFAGNAARAARQTLRTIPLELGGEEWYLQFSPYNYFVQHLIAFSSEHRPMKVSRATFERQADFVEMFKDYFIGSNADLPIVGGSVLAHDHYQGGAKVLPIFSRGARKNYYVLGSPDVNVSVVDWYNSVVRIESKSRAQFIDVCERFRSAWAEYSDLSVGIIASDGEQHNTVTPVTSMQGGEYRMDMILRNNRTDEKHPYGIFHPSEELHNIKKEGIGLIEAMGRFILPGRLQNEMTMIRDLLSSSEPVPFKEIADEKHPLHKHLSMIAQLAMDYGTKMHPTKANNVITDYVNTVCEKILDTTAVFKNDEQGQAAFDTFIKSVVGNND